MKFGGEGRENYAGGENNITEKRGFSSEPLTGRGEEMLSSFLIKPKKTSPLVQKGCTNYKVQTGQYP